MSSLPKTRANARECVGCIQRQAASWKQHGPQVWLPAEYNAAANFRIMKQEASTYLGLSGDGAAAKGVGVADALEAANALGLLRFLNDSSLHTPGVHVSTELSKQLSATSSMHSAVSAKQYLFTW